VKRKLLSVGFIVAVLGMLVIQCGDDDPCDPDPCLERNALLGTCQWYPTPRHWKCECIEGAEWNYDSKVCEGVVDRCVPDPCRLIAHAYAGTCVDEGGGKFSCDCDSGYVWDDTAGSCRDDPCYPDPCGIDNAVAGTCVDEGGGKFSCDCDSGYVWDGTSYSCEDDPCDPDPCSIDNAVADTCTAVGVDDFTCTCASGFFWKHEGNTCEDPCGPDPCEGIQNATPDTCTAFAWDDFTCDCDEGFEWNGGTSTCAEVVHP
jgi:hypothetical protein